MVIFIDQRKVRKYKVPGNRKEVRRMKEKLINKVPKQILMQHQS